MPTGRTITAKEAGVFLPGMRVKARYQGDGTVIVPSARMMDLAHFEDDVAVQKDDGTEVWIGASMLHHFDAKDRTMTQQYTEKEYREFDRLEATCSEIHGLKLREQP